MSDLNKCKLLINEGFMCLTATSGWAQEAKGKFNSAYHLSSTLRNEEDKKQIKVFSIWGLVLVNFAAKNGDDIVKLMNEVLAEDQGAYNVIFDSVEPFIENGCSEDDIACLARKILVEYCSSPDCHTVDASQINSLSKVQTPSRFVFKEDVVLDKSLNLVWLRDGNVLGKEVQYIYEERGLFNNVKKTHHLVEDSIKKLNSFKVGGYSKWRLPAISELRSLIQLAFDNGYGGNRVDPNYNNYCRYSISTYLTSIGFDNIQSGNYWAKDRTKSMWWHERGIASLRYGENTTDRFTLEDHTAYFIAVSDL